MKVLCHEAFWFITEPTSTNIFPQLKPIQENFCLRIEHITSPQADGGNHEIYLSEAQESLGASVPQTLCPVRDSLAPTLTRLLPFPS